MFKKLLDRRPLRRLAVSMAAGTLVATGLLTGVASPAQAAYCYDGPSAHPNGEGEGVFRRNVNMKAGPYTACGNIGGAFTGNTFWAHCYWQNVYGNVWYYGRIGGSSLTGWTSADNIRVVDGLGWVECR